MLLDTHALVWTLADPAVLSRAAREAIETSPARSISAASLYEIAFKAGVGKWPEVLPLLKTDLDSRLRGYGFEVVAATGAIMEQAGRLAWPHRDPFDRIIVATALARDLAVVSKDATLDGNGTAGWRRVW